MTMSSRMHLISFNMHSAINHTVMSWTDPADDRLQGLASFDHWKKLARTLERGRFDAMFFADTPGGFDRYKESLDDYVRYGVCWPSHDPMAVAGVMLAETTHLGFAVTLSTSGTYPYTTVRRLSTLDYLSGGRVGWNIVSGHLRGEHRALGLPQLEHDARYDHADEYMKICHALWNGIKPGAIKADRAGGMYADPAKVDVVDFEGEHFSCHAVPPTLPSAQGRPVLFQAGSSGRGQQFAMKHADVIFAIQPRLPEMIRFVKKLDETAASVGRADTPKAVFGIQCIIGATEEEAKRKQVELFERIPLDAALSRMSGTLGMDFSKIDLDQRLAPNDTQASRGMLQALANMAGDGNATVRDAARIFGASCGMTQVVGAPEQIADQLETLWRESGCHGFNITPAENVKSIEDFVDHVVPHLQNKGIFRREYESTTLSGNLAN